MQALVNAAAYNLAESQFRLKCIPAAICIMKRDDDKATDQYVVDPSLQELANCKPFSAKLFAVVDAGKEEFIYSSLKMLKFTSLDLGEVE